MEIKKLLFVFLVISITSITQAQITPYEPIVFTDITPVWQHVSIDSTLIDSTHDGMQQLYYHDRPFPFLIDGNSLYIANNTRIKQKKVRGSEGGLIENLDIRTGEVKWVKYFDLRNNDKPEYVECIYLNSDDNLRIVTDRRINGVGEFKKLQQDLGSLSLLCIREYDKNSGELLQHIYPDSNDPNAKRIRSSESNRTILYPLSDDRFIYIENKNIDYYIRDIIDKNGYLLTEPAIDSIKFDKYFNPDSVFQREKLQMMKINEDTLVTLNYIVKHDKKHKIVYKNFDRQTKLTLYDNDLKKINVFSY